jgi:hypothetical protein
VGCCRAYHQSPSLAPPFYISNFHSSHAIIQAFTLGSIIWVINGYFSFLPFSTPSLFTKEGTEDGAAWTAFIGATVFEFGSVFGMWEAWNRDDDIGVDGFGEAVENAIFPDHVADKKDGDLENGTHQTPTPPPDEKQRSQQGGGEGKEKEKKWIWFSADPKYWHEVGFLAAWFQLCAATIFWISGCV